MEADFDVQFEREPLEKINFAIQAENETDPATKIDRATLAYSGDELDQALLAMPPIRAPRHTLAQVLARITTLPQFEGDAAALSIGLIPPRQIKYAPPVLAPLETRPISDPVRQASRSAAQFNPLGYLIIGLWLSLCLFGLYELWPGIANLVWGPPQDATGLARLQILQSWWANFSANITALFNALQPYLPMLISAATGIVIMLYIFNQQRRRLWLE